MEYINRLLHRSPTNSSSPSTSPVPENIGDNNTFSEAAISEHETKLVEPVRVKEISDGTNESETVINEIDGDRKDLSNINESINENTGKNEPVAEVFNNIEGISNTNGKGTDADNGDGDINDTININENEEGKNSIIKQEIDINDTYRKEISIECMDDEESRINQELESLNIKTKESNDRDKEEEIIYISKDINEEECVQLECKNNSAEPLYNENKTFEETPVTVHNIINQVSLEELDNTNITFCSDICTALNSLNKVEQYEDLNLPGQKTSSPEVDTTLKDLELAAGTVANDILQSSLEFEEILSTPALEIFEDPTAFDFLLTKGNLHSTSCQRNESLYITFDPLLTDISMLPQENGKVFGTPPSSTIHKLHEIQEKNDETIQVSQSDTEEVKDADVTDQKLVRATILQLEKELEKQKKEFNAELEQQKKAFEEKIIKFQAKLSHEIENKNRLTVVVDEYEKSISRLLTEKERDRTHFEQERVKLQEELQATNHHLSSTEAAFNDVHLKYERLKGVVAAYKNNEEVLKESIQENLETIKSLENRYEQLKGHAMSQLKKANYELVDVRKQHEVEIAKLHALMRKAELKSNSLAEVVEQKTKENKELTQILDELIARVGRQDAE